MLTLQQHTLPLTAQTPANFWRGAICGSSDEPLEALLVTNPSLPIPLPPFTTCISTVRATRAAEYIGRMGTNVTN